MNRLLVICGPTATGKTALGIRLAKRFTGEIVSADSRQVYIGMDVGTGKDLPVNAKLKIKNEKIQIKIKNGQILKPYRFNKIPVWMLDVVTPVQEFSVADYVELAWKIISDIWKRKKLPIIVGGTGFYIKGVIDGIEALGVPPDWKLREKLRNLEIKKLGGILEKKWPERWQKMNESDRQNPRRLIRAIEIATVGHSLYHRTSTVIQRTSSLFIGLTAPFKILYQRIDKRVEERVKQGVEDEIRNLLARGYTWDNSVLETTIGYKEWRSYMGHGKDREKIICRWKFDEHAYARRQMTWFRKDKRICWFDITKGSWQQEVEKLVKKWYSTSNL